MEMHKSEFLKHEMLVITGRKKKKLMQKETEKLVIVLGCSIFLLHCKF